MIATLPMLRLALGIAADDTTQDALLTQLESLASAWVERQTSRRWDTPTPRVERMFGTGTPSLYLEGTPAPVDADAAGVIVIAVRERVYLGGDWAAFLDFELDGARRLVRTDGYIWHPAVNYEVTYHDGFLEAPGDIRGLVIDLVRTSRNTLAAQDAEAAIKSESIGDYSYSLDAAVTSSQTTLSPSSLDVINRRRRLHI